MNRRALLRQGVKVAMAGLVVGLVMATAFVSAPIDPELLDYRPVASVKIYDRQGRLLRELRGSEGRSTPLTPAQIPEAVRVAFLAAEDKGFMAHHGLSPTSILRALLQNLKAGRVVAGGSTITQQLARTLVPRERSVVGKAQEALWALRLEAHLSKEEIFTQYLNRVPFGNNTVGIEAASQLYFGKSAHEVSLAQAAMLAAVPRGPSAYNPYRAQKKLEARRQWVLSRLQANGFADAHALEQARGDSLDFTAFTYAFAAPHFVAFVKAHLEAWGLHEATEIVTSLDADLQAQVETQIAQELSRLAERRVGSAAALVVDNASGQVLAYVGSADFFSDAIGGQNDGIQMRRQPGSALKPFVYAEAFRRGYTPATVIPDLETAFASNVGAYAPKNYDRRLHGPVRAREALANSYNVPAVRVADAVGLDRVLTVLRRAGFDSLAENAGHYGLGLALGNGEVSLWEAGRAYAGLANGGTVAPLVPVLQARRADGSEIALHREFAPRRFAEPHAVALVTDVLSDNAARARAFGLNNALRLPFPTAAKTGTSKGYSDNWTIGFTHERTVAVWAGNFDGTPMVQVSGITGAGPIFKRVMTRAMANVTPGPLLDETGLTTASICPLSGQLAGPHCPTHMPEHFLAGTEPTHGCEMHREQVAAHDAQLQQRCEQLAARSALTDLGADYYDWARNEGLAEEPWLASSCLTPVSADSGQTRLLHPQSGDEFMLLNDLPLADQAIPVRVRNRTTEARLGLWVDGELALTLSAPFTGRIPARGGRHVVSLRDASGRELDRAEFTVRHERRL